jgi:5-dehydro-2-deoxygluconokinase
MIFYRSDCADMALEEADVDEALVQRSKAIVVTGTHFSRPNTDGAQRKAIRIARAAGRKVVFDIDYRPNLWGLAGHDAGFERYVKSETVSRHLGSILPDCDLVVGTEEEIMIASGADDVLAALKAIRAVSTATIVLKRGAMGCIVYDGPISDDLEDGIHALEEAITRLRVCQTAFHTAVTQHGQRMGIDVGDEVLARFRIGPIEQPIV